MGRAVNGAIAAALGELGLAVVPPQPVTDRTIKLGVANSPEMICFPYKVTLGSLIEALQLGADTLLMYQSGKNGACRQKQFWRLQAHQLRRLGYSSFSIHPVHHRALVSLLARLSGKSRWGVLRVLKRALSRLAEAEAQQWSETERNIGIIGEVYCCCEERINYDIEAKIRSYGANPFRCVTLTSYYAGAMAEDSLCGCLAGMIADRQRNYHRRARELFEGRRFAGHAVANIANLYRLVDKGVDGVVHLLPLTCMPETTIEPYVDSIAGEAGVPVLRIPIDESNSEANFKTRLETFVKLIQWQERKRK